MKRLADFRKQVIEGWTVQRIAAVLIVVGLTIFVVGIINTHCACAALPNLGETLNDVISDFYANVSVDCLSIAFAILVIDRLNERRAEQELKAQFIRDMGSTDNGIALRAVQELRARGWLEDGSLHDAYFGEANLRHAYLGDADLQGVILSYSNLKQAYLIASNLEGAFLSQTNLIRAILDDADLQGAELIGANLKSAWLTNVNLQNANLAYAKLQYAYLDNANLRDAADLREQQLVELFCLRNTIMPNGSLYDGRYQLYVDIDVAKTTEEINPDDPQAMASFYGVSLEEYLAGQAWAREHLADLRRDAGLDPDTGRPLLQPADAPAAPRRNAHKASMVAHRVRR
jgi:uncharacterized protein YjbI with pentapeptide repeats